MDSDLKSQSKESINQKKNPHENFNRLDRRFRTDH